MSSSLKDEIEGILNKIGLDVYYSNVKDMAEPGLVRGISAKGGEQATAALLALVEKEKRASTVPTWLLISAVRYALGRMTYIVSTTVDYVIPLVPSISDRDRGVMLRDIQEYPNLGHETDRNNWERLRVALQEPKHE